MFLRYLGLSVVSIAGGLLVEQVIATALCELPEAFKEDKAYNAMYEKDAKIPVHKTILKAAKRRVEKIKKNPVEEIVMPLKNGAIVCLGMCIGHSIGIRQGIEYGVENGIRKFESIIVDHVPEQYKSVVRGMLDKNIKRSNIYKNVRHGMFKDKVDVIDYNWEKSYTDFYGTPEDKELEVSCV
jgi:hypothetical protein